MPGYWIAYIALTLERIGRPGALSDLEEPPGSRFLEAALAIDSGRYVDAAKTLPLSGRSAARGGGAGARSVRAPSWGRRAGAEQRLARARELLQLLGATARLRELEPAAQPPQRRKLTVVSPRASQSSIPPSTTGRASWPFARRMLAAIAARGPVPQIVTIGRPREGRDSRCASGGTGRCGSRGCSPRRAPPCRGRRPPSRPSRSAPRAARPARRRSPRRRRRGRSPRCRRRRPSGARGPPAPPRPGRRRAP